ncbi:hypothetical protein D3C87_2152620 [compost metagenome]
MGFSWCVSKRFTGASWRVSFTANSHVAGLPAVIGPLGTPSTSSEIESVGVLCCTK